MTMPRMSGEESLAEIRRLSSNVKVILSSGFHEIEATERFAGKGHDGFIQKPYRLAALGKIFKEVLGN